MCCGQHVGMNGSHSCQMDATSGKPSVSHYTKMQTQALMTNLHWGPVQKYLTNEWTKFNDALPNITIHHSQETKSECAAFSKHRVQCGFVGRNWRKKRILAHPSIHLGAPSASAGRLACHGCGCIALFGCWSPQLAPFLAFQAATRPDLMSVPPARPLELWSSPPPSCDPLRRPTLYPCMQSMSRPLEPLSLTRQCLMVRLLPLTSKLGWSKVCIARLARWSDLFG